MFGIAIAQMVEFDNRPMHTKHSSIARPFLYAGPLELVRNVKDSLCALHCVDELDTPVSN